MKYTTVSPANCDFTPRLISRGKWRVKCDVAINGRTGSFYCTINDSELIDKLNQMDRDQEPYDFKQAAWFEHIFPMIEEDVNEWRTRYEAPGIV